MFNEAKTIGSLVIMVSLSGSLISSMMMVLVIEEPVVLLGAVTNVVLVTGKSNVYSYY